MSVLIHINRAINLDVIIYNQNLNPDLKIVKSYHKLKLYFYIYILT